MASFIFRLTIQRNGFFPIIIHYDSLKNMRMTSVVSISSREFTSFCFLQNHHPLHPKSVSISSREFTSFCPQDCRNQRQQPRCFNLFQRYSHLSAEYREGDKVLMTQVSISSREFTSFCAEIARWIISWQRRFQSLPENSRAHSKKVGKFSFPGRASLPLS